MWGDEFDGPAPDPRFWTHETGAGGWGDNQLQTYTDSTANTAITAEGHLAITALPDLTSARLVTKGRFAAQHGVVEARIKVPAGPGVWPAFWMLGTDIDAVGWPQCGEIDVMEFVGSEPRRVHGTVHGPGFAGVGLGVGHAHDTGVDLSDDFHVYGVDWKAERITWLLDGEPYFTVTPSTVPEWVFQHEFYLLLTLAIGGAWPGNEAVPPLPATMLVDWVRVS